MYVLMSCPQGSTQRSSSASSHSLCPPTSSLFNSTPAHHLPRLLWVVDLLSISRALTQENKDWANAVNPGSNLFVIFTHLKCTCYPQRPLNAINSNYRIKEKLEPFGKTLSCSKGKQTGKNKFCFVLFFLL